MTAAPAQGPWSARFRREREPIWRELDKLVGEVERRGFGAIGPEALGRLPSLYRATLSSLSVARAAVLDRNLLDHLESLAARAHLCLCGPRERVPAAIGRYCRTVFPRAARAVRAPLLLASLVLALGFAIAFVLCQRDLELYWYFIDGSRAQGRDPTATTEELRATLFFEEQYDGGALGFFAAWLWTHNSQVTLLAFGLAILGGVPGLLLLLVTGLELGAMSALFHDRGLAVEWWSWVLPHGVTELLAVLLGTAAGLHVAQGLVFAGPHGRLRAMAEHGKRAGPLLFGAMVMLFLAGNIEGVFRQTVQVVPVRYALVLLSALLWLVYLGYCGRREP